MEYTPNYDNYTLDELLQARSTIDAEAYPERAAELERRIAAFQQSAGTNDPLHPSSRGSKIRFHGNTNEYFAIWIVNLLLTIVTLGIYSAWAKVRTNRYFYGNTELDGHRFSYLAEPIQILKGRIIAAVLFAAYYILGSTNPTAAAILALCVGLMTPFIVVLGMRFKMRMTAYRNIRFNFKGTYGRAFLVFVLLPVISIFTLYLLLPWALKKMDQFLVENTGFGDRVFETELSTSEYYASGLGAFFIALIMFFVGAVVVGLVMAGAAGNPALMSLSTFLFVGLYVFIYATAAGFYHGRIRNHIFATSALPDVARFHSDIPIGGLIMLYLTNTLAIICSLGFAIPWAKIRMAQFYADATYVDILPGIEDVVAGDSGSVGATAEEAATLFDVDIALG